MSVDILVGNPERITNQKEISNIIKKIDKYKEVLSLKKEDVGVLLIQNRQLGAIYFIMSEKEATGWINKPITQTTPEIGIKFWSYSYFEELKEKLEKKPNSKKYN